MMKSKIAGPVSRPARWKDRKLWLLATLVLLLGFSVWYHAGGGSGSEGQPGTQRAAARPAAEKGDALQSGDPTLLMEKLRDEMQEEPRKSGHRNLYEFGAPPAAPVQRAAVDQKQEAPPPPPEPAVCGDQQCQAGESWQNCPSDCDPPPPPPITLKYIGYLKEQNGAVAFFTDSKGKEVFMARINEVVANQYRVLKITEDSVELGYLNNNRSSTLQFQGNNKS